MKTVVSTHSDAIGNAAQHIKRLLDEKPEAVLALSADNSTHELYSELVKMFKRSEVSFSRATVFSVTGYEGIPPDDGHSSKSILTGQLLGLVDIKSVNCRFLTEENMENYDGLISAAGGLDLAVLSLGVDGRVGFNAPATPYASLTHRQKLSGAVRQQLAPSFGGEDSVPQFGLTLGIKTICDAGEIVVLALGEERAEAAFKMLYGRSDGSVPATFLQLPSNVAAYIDDAAASKL